MIAANWKLHKNINELNAYFDEFQKHITADVPAVFFTSPILLDRATQLVSSMNNISTGAQNISENTSGAFTGETSLDQVLSTGAQWALVGHSERRTLFGETDALVHKKVKLATEANLNVLLCVGESLAERESGQTEDVILRQLSLGLADLRPDNLALAYEPVWAIGTGKVATVTQASAAHKVLKAALVEMGLKDTPILYGGSVKSTNAKELLTDPYINGLLVGGASLDALEFSKIFNAARET